MPQILARYGLESVEPVLQQASMCTAPPSNAFHDSLSLSTKVTIFPGDFPRFVPPTAELAAAADAPAPDAPAAAPDAPAAAHAVPSAPPLSECTDLAQPQGTLAALGFEGLAGWRR